MTDTVDPDTCNPLKTWHQMGEPANPTEEQMAILRDRAYPFTEDAGLRDENGSFHAVFRLKRDSVVRFRLIPVARETEDGYDYGFYR